MAGMRQPGRALMRLAGLLMFLFWVTLPGLQVQAMALEMLATDGICHADPGTPSGDGQAPAHHMVCDDCLCCHVGPLVALPPDRGPALPLPRPGPAGARAKRPRADGPPRLARRPFQSRAPPHASV